MSSIERIPKGSDVCLIDGDSLLYYEMEKPTFEEALMGLDGRISHMLSQCNTNHYAGFLTRGKCFRYEVDPQYKARRKDTKARRPVIFPALQEHLMQNWGFTYTPELEADDLVSYYSYNTERKTIICSPDKDVLYQCVGMHYNYRTAEFIHTSPEEALKFLWKQVLMGDSTDGIPGLKGVGEKTSDNWLKDRTKDFESFALKKYVEQCGMTEGIFRFNQTFRLVYLLKTDEDMTRELGTSFEIPELKVLTNNPVDSEGW
jgi:5'-3' exonuclease